MPTPTSPSKATLRQFVSLLQDLKGTYKLNDSQLAAVLGKPRQTVTCWITGKRKVSTDALIETAARVAIADEVLSAVRARLS